MVRLPIYTVTRFLGIVALFASRCVFAQNASVEFVPQWPDNDPDPEPVVLVLEGIHEASHRLSVSPGQRHALGLPVGNLGHLRVESTRYWSKPQVISPADGSHHVSVALRPLSWVEGKLEASGDGSSLDEMSGRFRWQTDGVGGGLAQWLDIACEILPELRFRCPLPAGRHDVRLRVRGFISHPFWDLAMQPWDQHDLGTLRLQRGASVVGWLQAPSRDFSYAASNARLSPKFAGSAQGDTDAERRRSAAQSARIDEHGYFSFEGIRPGSYRLTVEHPEYAPRHVFPVDVVANTETELNTIELRPPVDLEVRVIPALAPEGGSWRMQLLVEGDEPSYYEPVAAGAASESGAWKASRLSGGEYELLVEDGRGNRWHHEELSLWQSEERLIELPLEKLSGQVLLGDEPVQAKLYFGGRNHPERVRVESGEDGAYSAVLPRREHWLVDVYVPSHGNAGARLRDQSPVASGEEGKRILDIAVSGPSIAGRVVDEAKDPVEGAVVRASGSLGGTSTLSDEDGSYTLWGLEPGEWLLEAELVDEDLSSELIPTTLETEVSEEDIELVLRPLIRVSGQVVDAGGQALAGAQIFGVVEQEPARPLTRTYPEAATGAEGLFTLYLPSGAQGLQLNVMAAGYPLHQARVDLTRQEPVLLVLGGESSGTVEVVVEGEDPSLTSLALFHHRLLPMSWHLQRWANLWGVSSSEPGRLIVPALPTGPYTACLDAGDRAYLTGLPIPSPGAVCTQGDLSPGGHLELVLRR